MTSGVIGVYLPVATGLVETIPCPYSRRSRMSQEAGGPKIKLNTGHLMPLIGFGTYKVSIFILLNYPQLSRLLTKKQ